jgi:hypothetical protein
MSCYLILRYVIILKIFGEEHRNIHHAVLSCFSSYFTFFTSRFSHHHSVVKHHKSTFFPPVTVLWIAEEFQTWWTNWTRTEARIYLPCAAAFVDVSSVEFTSCNERFWVFYTVNSSGMLLFFSRCTSPNPFAPILRGLVDKKTRVILVQIQLTYSLHFNELPGDYWSITRFA